MMSILSSWQRQEVPNACCRSLLSRRHLGASSGLGEVSPAPAPAAPWQVVKMLHVVSCVEPALHKCILAEIQSETPPKERIKLP